MAEPERPRGFFAIGIENGKDSKNVGVLLRSANLYNAAFVFTIGARYQRQAGDTMDTPRHVPLIHFKDVADLIDHLPEGCTLVGIENAGATPLRDWTHPERAVYLLGAEDQGLSPEALEAVKALVEIECPRPLSMNVAVAGSIIMHDRFVSRKLP